MGGGNFCAVHVPGAASGAVEAQASSSPQVLTGWSWGSAKRKMGGRIVGGEEKEGERKEEGKRKRKRKRKRKKKK